jgi:hypothetical protein
MMQKRIDTSDFIGPSARFIYFSGFIYPEALRLFESIHLKAFDAGLKSAYLVEKPEERNCQHFISNTRNWNAKERHS